MQKVVGVKFSASNKVYTFDTNGIELSIGDEVIVDSALGLSFGTVATAVKTLDEKDLPEGLKTVIRKASEKDKKRFEELKTKASKDIVIVREKVKNQGLEMKVVSCEYTFDGSKIIIEFSAEDRVDFRELLKELASALKVRIELHQVGQRDEVKIKGGIGPCGEICCCVRFLKDFEHVTVKMAKNQGLSLSPTKISGLCGRLMCCLAYENKTYEEILKKLPKVNKEIDTPKGRGTVVYNDILRERVSVKIKNGEDNFTVYDFSLAELNGEAPQEEKEEEKPQNVEVKTFIPENKRQENKPEKTEKVEKQQAEKKHNEHKNNFKHNKFKKNKFKHNKEKK
ncbi:MAG: stage 0 sporulation family protein [Clostridia bacterium]|nr:stage 0 sporulation family protein [Clostridia bacterium]